MYCFNKQQLKNAKKNRRTAHPLETVQPIFLTFRDLPRSVKDDVMLTKTETSRNRPRLVIVVPVSYASQHKETAYTRRNAICSEVSENNFLLSDHFIKLKSYPMNKFSKMLNIREQFDI